MYKGKDRANIMLKAIVIEDKDKEKYALNMKSFADFANGEAVDEGGMSILTDEETLAKDSEKLKETSAISFSRDANGFSATVSRTEETLVFFSVPYSEGFTATVNGETAEIVKANVGFMAVAVPEGVSEIRFNYTTPLLKEGVIVSLSSLIVFLIYLFACSLIKHKYGENEVYPEGEKLLDKWTSLEFSETLNLVENSHTGTKNLLDAIPENKDLFVPVDNEKYNSFNVDLSAFEDKENVDNEDNQ
jgi:hypothetical protein